MNTIDKCAYYRKEIIQGKSIYIFDSHNMALPVWGTYASQIGPLHLLTFDSHTDTCPAFNRYLIDRGKRADIDFREMEKKPEIIRLLSNMHYNIDDYSFDDVFQYSCNMLNSEQILTGVAFGYLSSYTICCHAAELYEKEDRNVGFDATYINDRDKRTPEIRYPLVLDVDLDYFRSRAEMSEDFLAFFRQYFHAAYVVTIAREPTWFEKTKRKSEIGFSVDEAEKRLLDIMERC